MARFKPSPAMMVALLALFVAFGGTGYAALKLPRNSVGAAQIKANAVRSTEVEQGSLRASDFGASQLSSLRGPRGVAGPRGSQGRQGVAGAAATKLFALVSTGCASLVRGSGAVSVTGGTSRCDVRFDRDVSSCVPMVTVESGNFWPGEASATTSSEQGYVPGPNWITIFRTTSAGGFGEPRPSPFYVAVFC